MVKTKGAMPAAVRRTPDGGYLQLFVDFEARLDDLGAKARKSKRHRAVVRFGAIACKFIQPKRFA